MKVGTSTFGAKAVGKERVVVYIDHQSFDVNWHPVTDKKDPEYKFNKKRKLFYVKMLKIALSRLAQAGKKAHGSVRGTNQKKKAKHAKPSRRLF